MSRRVELRPAAERDLDRLAEFVAQLDPRAGDKRERDLREALRKLGERPFKGRPGPQANLRQLTIRFGRSSYLIRYRVTDDAVIVTRIWHGKEDRPPR
ncbi:MAG: type II toxin-antitoxin system RelE/ParE family toxin [Hyphomonadaceae bacterium]|nr:type II toxin-antitoxin system RelE/ParE family toxin [Hyphomonadaceae bacterium]